MSITAVRTEVHEGGRPDGGAAGADAARSARPRSRSRDRGLARSSRSELGADYIQLSAALHPTRVRRAARGDARSGRQHARPAAAVRQGARAGACRRRSTATGVGISDIGYFDNMLHHDPAIAAEEARLHAARVRRGGAARRRRRVRVRRPQPAAQHGPEPRRLRGAVRAAAEGGEGARPDLPRRAVPDARLDDRRQLAQQHRLHAGHVDRAAPHLREARRRRPVPHPLRPVARHPDGPGHALDLSVPEGRAATTS